MWLEQVLVVILLERPHYPQVCQDNGQALKKQDHVMESVLGFCHCDNTLETS